VKRFLVFAGDEYYASGGWKDFVAEFDTLECARVFADAKHTEEWQSDRFIFGGVLQWVHIVDTIQSKLIWRREDGKES